MASRPLFFLVILFLAMAVAIQGCTPEKGDPPSDLQTVFSDPPESARPRGYWLWPNGHFDYETIKTELRAFKEKGLGGVDIFDLGVRDDADVIPPGPGFLSPEQIDGIAFALEEAKKLDLKMGLIVSSSWNAGGEWTPPELAAMNMVVHREIVEGPETISRVLPVPELPDAFSKPYGDYPLYPPRDEDGRPVFYEDVAVLLVPANRESEAIDSTEVIDLTASMGEDGNVTIDIPEGQWELQRFVVANFGQMLWLPSDGSAGLTMDHFSKEATRFHFETVIDRLEKRMGPLEDTAMERLYLASYESNADILWTPGLEESFFQDHGYRIESYLPALVGYTVQSEDITNRFLYDYRRTASDLFVENLYREASRICKEHGLLITSEAGGPGPPLHDVPTEDLKALGAVDVKRGEFWNRENRWYDDDGFDLTHVVKGIASAAHIYGQTVVEMEAFTSHINWQEGPMTFKPLADRAFAEGTNRVVYHTMAHNVPMAGVPGWTYQAGTHISTNLTWWDLSDQLHDYLARSSALLQEGMYVADVAYYYGHAIPNFTVQKHIRPGLGYGYEYDDLNTEVLLQASVDASGRLVLPGGMSYAVLVLPDDPQMELVVAEKIEALVRDGATVVGPKPSRVYTLRDYPERDRQLAEIADRLWVGSAAKDSEDSSGPGSTDQDSGGIPDASSRFESGDVIDGIREREILMALDVGPDLQVFPESAERRIDFIHRRTDSEEIYFLYNRDSVTIGFEALFRVKGKQPEFWDAVTGETNEVAVFVEEDSGIRLLIQLPAHGSLFVIFTSETSSSPHIVGVSRDGIRLFPDSGQGMRGIHLYRGEDSGVLFDTALPGSYELTFDVGSVASVTVAPPPEAIALDGPWTVRFPHGWQVPIEQQFDSLYSWSESPDSGTRAFSGTAVYHKTFSVDEAGWPDAHLATLNLGDVREVARVYLNGEEVGLSSFVPHTLDVTGVLRRGENHLVVEVANTWLNRLIVDDGLPPGERLTHTNLTRGPTTSTLWRDARPLPSGLLGSVRIEFRKATVVD